MEEAVSRARLVAKWMEDPRVVVPGVAMVLGFMVAVSVWRGVRGH